MHQLIIFSKDRAYQLEGLLNSIYTNTNIWNNITIIYTSSYLHLESYNILKHEYPNINWVLEENFKKNVLACKSTNGTTTFMVDDDIIFSSIDTTDILTYEIFSLRLGLNTIWCYPMKQQQKLNNYEINNLYLTWNWNQEKLDYNYPLSLDGHIFNSEMIWKLICNIEFNNPNTLEANLQIFRNNISHIKMNSFINSKLMSIPINKVNTVYDNRYGENYYKHQDELLQLFLDGNRMRINITTCSSPHEEINIC